MAIVSFWSNGKTETGKTASIAAIATYLAIEHNYKILILDTKYNDYSYQDCYWQEDKTLSIIHRADDKTNIASGITGLSKAILSNKTSPEIITNYTRIIFKDRLELLTEVDALPEDYEVHKDIFNDIAKIAGRYYDLVFVDVSSELGEKNINSLLRISDIVVPTMSQKIRQIDDYLKIKKENPVFEGKVVMPLLGRYDKNSKYTAKNVSRYMKERGKICVIPYNTLFFEACNEGTVDDFFIKFRKINPKDKNARFIKEVKDTSETLIGILQELRKRM